MSTYVLSENTARKLRAMINGQSRVETTVAPHAALDNVDFPPPFAVQYSASVNNGDGGWVIYLPGGTSGDKCLTVDGVETPITAGLAAVGDVLGDGWYALDFLEPAGGYVFLQVEITASGVAAKLVDSTSEQTTDIKRIIHRRVCEPYRNSETGEVTVYQYAVGAQAVKTGVTTDETHNTVTDVYAAEGKLYRKSREVTRNATGEVTQIGSEGEAVEIGSIGITADESFRILTDIGYDTSTGYIWTKERAITVVNGLIVAVGEEETVDSKIATVAHSAD